MDQKEEEKLVMSIFRKNYPFFPKGRLMPSESPDFILKTGRHKTIGFELTRIADPSADLISEIRKALIKKVEKHVLYQKKVLNEIWLLLFTDDVQDSFSISDPIIIELKERNPFQKVFLLDLFSGGYYPVLVS